MQLAVCEFARNTLGWTGNNLSCYSNLQKKSFQASFLTFRSKTEREVLSDLCWAQSSVTISQTVKKLNIKVKRIAAWQNDLSSRSTFWLSVLQKKLFNAPGVKIILSKWEEVYLYKLQQPQVPLSVCKARNRTDRLSACSILRRQLDWIWPRIKASRGKFVSNFRTDLVVTFWPRIEILTF